MKQMKTRDKGQWHVIAKVKQTPYFYSESKLMLEICKYKMKGSVKLQWRQQKCMEQRFNLYQLLLLTLYFVFADGLELPKRITVVFLFPTNTAERNFSFLPGWSNRVYTPTNMHCDHGEILRTNKSCLHSLGAILYRSQTAVSGGSMKQTGE